LDAELKRSDGLNEKCKLCEDNIASEKENGPELINLCKKICRIILNVPEILDKCKASDDNKKCQYMSHWLYDKVISFTNGTHQFLNLYVVLSMYSVFNKEKFKNCTLENFNVDKETFNRKHILYEFLESYDDMKKKIDSQSELYTALYCKLIKENFLFYNEVKDKCTSQATCGYFEQLKRFKGKFSQKGELNYIYQKCKYKETTCKDPYNIINVLLNVAIISVPTLAIFLIMFKFTPFGGKLNRINAKRRKTGSKKKEENIEDYMNNYAAYVDNIMKNRVNVAYHAS
ncbi:variable surface protein Vir23, truncated, putative, partial [Plasmodium vivax]